MKKYTLYSSCLILVGIFSGIAGFKIGTEKMWANATAYYTSGTLSRLEKLDGKLCSSENSLGELEDGMRSQLASAVQVYGRYSGSWISQLSVSTNWDDSTNRMMAPITEYYLNNSELDYKLMSLEEYWSYLQMADPQMYEKIRKDDPELFNKLRKEAIIYLENVKNAIGSGRL